jgi:hypothetical protein
VVVIVIAPVHELRAPVPGGLQIGDVLAGVPAAKAPPWARSGIELGRERQRQHHAMLDPKDLHVLPPQPVAVLGCASFAALIFGKNDVTDQSEQR